MTLIATVAAFAAVICRPGDAPLFTLPKPAVTNGALREAAIPFRNNTRLFGRLDGQVMSALYGTTEALLERRYFPYLFNYGKARTATVEDLKSADFGVMRSLYDDSWFFSHHNPTIPYFNKPENRDFSRFGTRVAWPVSLLDGVVFGDREISVADVAVDASEVSFAADMNRFFASDGSVAWLVPSAFAGNLKPNGEWQERDALSTADWQGSYLLGMSEVPTWPDAYESVIGGANVATWGGDMIKYFKALVPEWVDALMKELRTEPPAKPYFDDLAGRGSRFSMPELYYANIDAPYIAYADGPSRFMSRRFAFANITASLCSRTLDYPSTVKWCPATALASSMLGRAPRYRYNMTKYSGWRTATAEVTIPPDAVQAAFADDVLQLEIDMAKVEVGKVTATNGVTDFAFVAEQPCAAWVSSSNQVSLTVSGIEAVCDSYADYGGYWEMTPANPDVDFSDYAWRVVCGCIGHGANGSLLFEVAVAGTRKDGQNVAAFQDGTSVAKVGCAEIRASGLVTNCAATVFFRDDVRGVEPASGNPRSFIGATGVETPSGDDGTSSIAPAARAKFLYDSGIISSVQVHGFSTVGMTTNAAVVAAVAGGGAFNPPTSPFEVVNKETSVFFRCKDGTTGGGVTAHEGLVVALQGIAATVREDVEEVAQRFNPSGTPQPTKSVALSSMKDSLAGTVRGMGKVNGGLMLDISILATGYDGATVANTPGTAAWGASIDKSRIKLDFSVTCTTNLAGSASAAYSFDVKPVVITEWKFPMMREDKAK